MDTLRDISIRFFKLTLSQKSEIAGKLNLLEEEDTNQPDFERFRRVFLRARDRGLVNDLDREVKEAAARGRGIDRRARHDRPAGKTAADRQSRPRADAAAARG